MGELKTAAQLERTAVEECLEHVREVVPGEILVEPGEGVLEFDEEDLRHLFDQSLTVWRRFGEMEIVLDEEDRPVGFVDPGQQEDCVWMPLPESEILRIVRATGYARPDWQVLRHEKQDDGSLFAALGPIAGGFSRERAHARINPRRKTVIALRPVAEERP